MSPTISGAAGFSRPQYSTRHWVIIPSHSQLPHGGVQGVQGALGGAIDQGPVLGPSDATAFNIYTVQGGTLQVMLFKKLVQKH